MLHTRRLLALAVLLLLLPGSLRAQEVTQKRRVGPFTITVEADRTPVLSQGRTGTCWSFATMSYLESEVARLNGKAVDLSEMFVVRNAIRQKAERYVAAHGKAQFGQGGLSHDVIAMVREYGIVPAAAYPGLVDGDRIYNHTELFGLLKASLEKLAKPRRRGSLSKHWQKAIMGMVDAYLGTPPTKVKTAKGTVSPVEYANKVLRLPLGEYVEVMSLADTPFHQDAELHVPDNWMHFKGYKNLPVDELMAIVDNALMHGFTVAADMDVSEKGFRMGKGVARMPPELEKKGAITQAVRDEMFHTGKTTDDHLMHVVGMARDDQGGKYYYTKNSWGARSIYKGYLFISENFLRAKTLAIMVHKDALPQAKNTNN